MMPSPAKNTDKSTFDPSHARKVLELDKVLALLEQQCASELGRALVAALEPVHERSKVLLRLRETSQTAAFLRSGKTPVFGGICDLKSILALSHKGFLLEPSQIGKVGRFVEGARRLGESLREADPQTHSRIFQLSKDIITLQVLEKAIFNAIDINNDAIRDNASVRLLKARRAISAAKDQIQERLRSLTGDANIQPHLQDNFVTIRNGRYCLPVKSESRSAVPGIMHDRSASGGAVFIEPQSVVDANNRLREWESEEREAVEEILRDLTLQINEAYPHLKRTQKAAGKLDFAFAKGRLSIRQIGVEPLLSESPQTYLREARHPLIENPVPNDIILGEDFNVLLITGPNTGGKTVVLKTLGLLTLMAACGLHIPAAPKSTLWIPEQVFADIGDEQSLEQSLSTFSAHLKNVLRVVQNVNEGDLVLLDEAGAGTDPDEGAALAKAILRHLSRRKALVLASTHFGELKRFAISAQRFENASVEFDERSLRPSYHLRIGVPGSSNALHIARRLGLPAELVDRAKRYLGEQYAISEDATRQLEATGRELREQQIALEQSRAEAEKTQREYQRKIKQIEREKAQLLEQSQQQMAELIAQTQQESESILHELRKQHKESKATETARGRLKTLREKVLQQLPRKSTFDVADAKSTFEEEPESAAENQVRVGELVHVKQFNREGEVLSPPGADGKIEVRIGAMKMRLEPVQIKSLRERKDKSVHINVAAPLAASEEINLVGKTADEAIFLLEKYMDDAILAGLKNVWIIHGRGTGALRTAVRRWLKSHSAFSNFDYAPIAEGGDGATVVHLD